MTQLERNEKLIQIALTIIAISAISFLAANYFLSFRRNSDNNQIWD
jgi:hypothetical protein